MSADESKKKRRRSLLEGGHQPRTPVPAPERPPRAPTRLVQPPPLDGGLPSSVFQRAEAPADQVTEVHARPTDQVTEVHVIPSESDTVVLPRVVDPKPAESESSAAEPSGEPSAEPSERPLRQSEIPTDPPGARPTPEELEDTEEEDSDLTLKLERSKGISWMEPMELDSESTEIHALRLAASAEGLQPPGEWQPTERRWAPYMVFAGLGLVLLGGLLCAGLLALMGVLTVPAAAVRTPARGAVPSEAPVGDADASNDEPPVVETVALADPPAPEIAVMEPVSPARRQPAAAAAPGVVALRWHVENDLPTDISFVAAGERHPFGPLAPGSYEIEATFDAAPVRFAGKLELAPGTTSVQILCSAKWEKCRGVP